MKEFDLKNHYLLLQAFDLAGRHIFGEEWTGLEAWSRHVDDPQHSQVEKAALAGEIITIKRRRTDLQSDIEFGTDAEARSAAQKAYIDSSQKLRVLEDRFRSFPPSYDTWIAESDAYKRKTHIETLICRGFSDGDLTLVYRGGTQLAYDELRLHGGFRLNIALSQLRIPSGYRSTIVQSDRDSSVSSSTPYREPSRYAAFVDKKTFRQWLQKHAEGVGFSDDRSLEEQACEFLAELIRRAGEKVILKGPTCQAMQRQFSGLSERAFERIWKTSTSKLDWPTGRPAAETVADVDELVSQVAKKIHG